ncbi:MAG: DUF47 family protein [Lachnospiraceae bacterium]|jgi:uncharacterized protein Yka (UPF0111/DUF47 family)|nr:DUF47 family protein [Lachnospiraceae bacterium]
MAKKNNDYFQLILEQMEYAVEESILLKEKLAKFDSESLPEFMEQMHKLEHAADEKHHEIMKHLTTEFITPIEREDIVALSDAVDEIADNIEDVVIRLYMYNVETIRADADKFADIIAKCCESVRQALIEFKNFRKSKIMIDHIENINNLETLADGVFIEAMHRLFTEDTPHKELFAWEKLYERLEKCSDSCEVMAQVMESVILKNT